MSSDSNVGKASNVTSTTGINANNVQSHSQSISKHPIPNSSHKVSSQGTTSKAEGLVTHATDATQTVTTGIFKDHLERKQEALKNSKEYKQLKEKFIKIAEKDFNKIYSSTFQGKNDSVRDAFIEKHAEKLMESFLQHIDLKTKHEVTNELHSAWNELLTAMFPNNIDFKTLDEKHPFGDSGTKTVHIESTNTEITFTEKDGQLSAKVGDRTFLTNDKGLQGILKLQSKIYMADADKKTQSKCHKQAMKSLLGNAPTNLGVLQKASEKIAEGDDYNVFIGAQSVIQESINLGGSDLIMGDSDVLTPAMATTGSVGVGFGALTITQGLFQLHEALNTGISDHQFLKLYKQFEAQFDTNNPKLSDADRFNLKEIEQVAQAMRNYSKSQALGTSGVLNVLLGSSTILASVGTIAQVSTLAAASTGVGGGILIVSGGVEMAKACKKLQKIEKRKVAIENTENTIIKDKDAADYETGLVRSFLEIQADMIDNEKMKEHLNLTSGGGMVCGGYLLVAAAAAGVAGSAGLGAGAAVVLGGAAITYIAGQGYLFYQDHKIEQLQTKLLAQDIAQVKAAQEQGVENPYRNMRSSAGKLMEIYHVVKAEQNSKDGNMPTPISEHLIKQCIGINPEQFVSIMQDMDLNFMSSLKDENVISTGVFIKNESLAEMARATANNVKTTGIISGYNVNAALAGFVGAKGSKQAMQQAAETKAAKLEAKNELRAEKAAIKTQEEIIAKETEIKKKQDQNLVALSSNIEKVSQAIVNTEAKVTAQKIIDPDVKNTMSNAVESANNVLTEASSLASREKPVWEENANVEFQARDMMDAVNKNITQFEGLLHFTLNNKNITNRVKTYNNLQQQFELLKTIKKEVKVSLDLLEHTVKALREETRAELAIREGNLKLQQMKTQVK